MAYKELEKYILSHRYEGFEIQNKLLKEPEASFEEYKSSKLIKEKLLEHGFKLLDIQTSLETAFVAEFKVNNDGPNIGILGEYDALYGEEGCFHGCGHNLIAAGSFLSAIALKNHLLNNKISGTIRFYGCPAEELGQGKGIMCDEELFNDLDIAISWHPNSETASNMNTTLAMQKINYSFYGKESHASNTPFIGRSALDSAELMNIGANFLREHIPPMSQIQYSFINSGSKSSNVIPNFSEVEYTIRSITKQNAEAITKRVNNIALGASLMSGVKFKIDKKYFCENINVNYKLSHLVNESIQQSHKAYINSSKLTIPRLKPFGKKSIAFVSSDVGNVSHVVPTALFFVSAWDKSTMLHTEKVTSDENKYLAKNSIIESAMIMSLTAAKIFNNKKILSMIKREFNSNDD